MALRLLRSLVPGPLKRAIRAGRTNPPAGWAGNWLRTAPKWYPERLSVSPAGTDLVGWVVCRTQDRDRLTPTWNGQPFETVTWEPRPDMAAEFPFLATADGWATVGVRANSAAVPPAGSWVSVTLSDRASGRVPDYLGQPYWHRVPAVDDLPWPDETRRQRVHGDTDLEAYQRAGATVFGRLRDGLRQTTGRDFGDFPRVLDWGCGSGRVTRYFAELTGCDVTGIDVDPDNVGWCERNLSFAKFATIPLRPPTALPDAAFDLIIGVSIFTHLRERDQFAWLAELRRLIRPGGVLLLTTHGDAAAAFSKLSVADYRRWQRAGFADIANGQYDAALPEADYYRNTFHTEAYIRREWGRTFDIVAYRPGWFGLQELVVLTG